jgi:putative oxidoreductase
MLGPVIVNILSFHMFLDAENMAPAIVVTVLWFVVFSQVRSSFAGLFVAKKAGLEPSSRVEALTAA